jgi:hypothetical protein
VIMLHVLYRQDALCKYHERALFSPSSITRPWRFLSSCRHLARQTAMDDLRSVDAELARLQDHILDLNAQLDNTHSQILRLHRHRNSLVPLCRLPRDVLEYTVEIFVRSEHSLSIEDASRVPISMLEHPFGKRANCWLPIKDICYLLREVVHQMARVWSYIDLKADTDHLENSITRSAHAPMSVTVWNATCQDVHELLPMSDRIEYLNFSFIPQDKWPLEEMSAIPMPALRTVRFTAPASLSFPGMEYTYRSVYYRPPFVLEDTFPFQASARLTSLIVARIQLSDDVPRFPSLVYLDVCELDCISVPGRLLALLEGSPALRRAYVNSATCSANPAPVTRSVLDLSHLERLGMSGSLAFVAAVLPALRVPPDGYCIINTENATLRGEMDVNTDRRRHQAFRAACEAFGSSGAVPPVHLCAKASLYHGRPMQHGNRLFHIGSLPSEAVCLWIEHHRSTHLSMTYEDHVWDVAHVGGLLDQVRTLHAHQDALAKHLPASSTELTMLERLVIEAEGARVTDVSGLMDWLHMRAAAGRPIETLEFRGRGYVFCSQRSYASVADFGEELLREGAVHTFLINGQTI